MDDNKPNKPNEQSRIEVLSKGLRSKKLSMLRNGDYEIVEAEGVSLVFRILGMKGNEGGLKFKVQS